MKASFKASKVQEAVDKYINWYRAAKGENPPVITLTRSQVETLKPKMVTQSNRHYYKGIQVRASR